MKKKTPQEEVAVALFYDGKNAPKVTAKGHDAVARRIKEVAEKHDVPLYEDRLMAAVLAQMDLDEEIPPRLYVAVAEVIAFAYLMAGKVTGIRQD